MSDLSQIQLIRTQTLALLVTVTATQGPTYTVDGLTVNKGEYLKQLQDTIAWCDGQEAGLDPFEVITQAEGW